jgi:hypothetical protein
LAAELEGAAIQTFEFAEADATAMMVGLISMMTDSALQEHIAATTRALLSKG